MLMYAHRTQCCEYAYPKLAADVRKAMMRSDRLEEANLKTNDFHGCGD